MAQYAQQSQLYIIVSALYLSPMSSILSSLVQIWGRELEREDVSWSLIGPVHLFKLAHKICWQINAQADAG